MASPQSNGLVEIRSTSTDSKGFCCYQLGQYMMRDGKDMDYSEYHQFRQNLINLAKTGNCHYRAECPNYTASLEKMKKRGGYQLKLF